MRPFALLGFVCLLAGCSFDAFRSKPLQTPHGGGPGGIGRPEEVTYLPALGISLAAMTRTASGLYWRDLVVGQGAEARPGSVAVVHYTGWLPNGRKFDSSRDRGDPFTFTVGAGMVIAGWDEGVAGMRGGGRRQLVIPPELGYGAVGAGAAIPPNATLVFEVELVRIQEPTPPLADPGTR
jgi:hypothetical protein